ncbi:MAG: hypothetical protein K2X93_17985 [Candidatus Obscuribacterales bacterium]|nr:hypothetical protein [Candidatus Obscuribacterales bacterium]
MPFTRRFQILTLVAASIYFYWRGGGGYTALLGASITVNALVSYFALSTTAKVDRKRILLLAGVVFNTLVLCACKYAILIVLTVKDFDKSIEIPTSGLLYMISTTLPIGISFYCFEGISLTVDSVKGKFLSTRIFQHIRNTSLFIAFFPHLISGPILRAADFFPQIGPKKFSDIDWTATVKWITLGYFLKVFVADNLEEYTLSLRFGSKLMEAGTINNIFLLFAFSVQIFADFAGYSYIALGLAQLLGYSIPNNFNAPYISQSLSEFWKRWHISLSQWIRDYLFIPLGGSRCVWYRAAFNLIFVMVLGGFWHGAGWNFGLWGLLHGVGLAVEHLFRSKIKLSDHWLVSFGKMTLTFLFVTATWIMFMLGDITQLEPFFSAFFYDPTKPLDPINTTMLIYFAAPVLFLHLYYWNRENLRIGEAFFARPLVKSTILATMLFLTIFNAGSHNVFIYFKF